MRKSTKTTWSGIISALGTFALTLESPWKEIGAALVAIGVSGLGYFARDDNVSSEGHIAPKGYTKRG